MNLKKTSDASQVRAYRVNLCIYRPCCSCIHNACRQGNIRAVSVSLHLFYLLFLRCFCFFFVFWLAKTSTPHALQTYSARTEATAKNKNKEPTRSHTRTRICTQYNTEYSINGNIIHGRIRIPRNSQPPPWAKTHRPNPLACFSFFWLLSSSPQRNSTLQPLRIHCVRQSKLTFSGGVNRADPPTPPPHTLA